LVVAGLAGLAAGALAGGIASLLNGKFSMKAVLQGAAIGGTIGLAGGAALAYGVTGSALASTGAVASGLGFGAATVGYDGTTGFEQARQLLQAQQMRSGEGSGEFNFTATAAKHMNEAGRALPIQTLNDAIKSGIKLPDPQGTTANMYYTTMSRNGKMYNLEVLYDNATNTIMHFKYTQEAIGPLTIIPK